jgi:hypothetical protein
VIRSAVIAVLLIAETSVAQKTIAVTPVRLVQANAELGGYVEDRLAAKLRARGFQVTTPDDLQTLLGLERRRQLLGCSDDTVCYAELTDALGVSNVLLGRLTRLGSRFELDVCVIRQGSTKVIASASGAIDDEARLGSLVERVADTLADELTPAPAARPFRWRLWVPIIGGVVAGGGGAALLVTSQLEYASFTTAGGNAPRLVGDQAISAEFASLSLRRALGFAAVGLGVGLIAAGIVWNALSLDAPIEVSWSVSPSGAGVLVRGSF